MKATVGQYSIKQVATVTGISPGLIRKWEERYRFVAPIRAQNGYRLYSDQDINQLLAVKQLVEQGFSVKNAAERLNKQNLLLLDQAYVQVDRTMPRISEAEIQPASYIQRMIQAGSVCNDVEIDAIIHLIFHRYGLDFLIDEVVKPFLIEIGRLWETGKWAEYQEHVSSQVIRGFLLNLRCTIEVKPHAPIMIGSCLPGERHEIPVLIVLIKAMLMGWRSIYLGASPAPQAIEAIVQHVIPERVILSATTMVSFEEYPDVLRRLDHCAGCHPHIGFFIGGDGARKYMEAHTFQNIHFSDNIEAAIRPL